MAKKTNYLTELIERHERWKAEGGERLEEEDQAVAQELYLVFHTKPAHPDCSRFQARQWRSRRLVGLWNCPTRRAHDRAQQQFDQSLGSAVDVGDERDWTGRYLDALRLCQAHLDLVDQGGPSATSVVAQIPTSPQRVRAGDRQTCLARRSGAK